MTKRKLSGETIRIVVRDYHDNIYDVPVEYKDYIEDGGRDDDDEFVFKTDEDEEVRIESLRDVRYDGGIYKFNPEGEDIPWDNYLDDEREKKEKKEEEMITMYVREIMTYEFKVPKELEEKMADVDVKHITMCSDSVDIEGVEYETTDVKLMRELMYDHQLNLLN